ncbi:hypothetical protein BH20CHL3_BH20CHL3_12210 [soil metagenome]
MFNKLFASTAFLVTILVVTAGLFASATAQEATPAADGAMAHPAHIHSGTCDTLGDVVFPLEDVAAPEMAATPEATPEAAVASDGPVSASSITTVDVALDDILAAEHAINVHESAENIGNYISCGDVTGEPDAGTLDIDLLELNDSGYRGVARLVDNGDGTTTVLIMITQVDSGTPEASPVS